MRTRPGREPQPDRTTRRSPGLRHRIPASPAGRDADHAARADRDAGHVVTTLYEMHYRSLVRLASLLVSDLAMAEDIVQESFAAVQGRWRALPDAHAALCYLRRSVVRRSRAAPRFQLAAGPRALDLPGNGPEAGPPLQGSAVVSALRALPVRQREVLVLRYFADLPEAEIASATGISAAAVRNHAARAMSSLRAEFGSAGQEEP
jgi:DNA-directed RNA polymerase specialized sigma24 family protein